MGSFDYTNFTFGKSDNGKQLIIRGEVSNRSGRPYNAIAVRVILFSKNIPITNTIIVINGLPNGATKTFEKQIEDLDYNEVAKSITGHEIYVESAY